ncbi:glycine zipper 2TM domain-containing protein [Simplicispira lacusdiani]|uniref:glycine zipper 2TM domain-containing protein n=1 Tax=Simplicispira lacusdiani TaxID=2213010 RepID=UPI000E72CA80|nr:glycine zipper 2TM domain-containing protein [Simplicispira lacusdiani]
MNTPAPASVSAPGAVPPSAVPQRWLWAAVGVLGAVVLALGGALAMQQRGPVESPVANVPRTPEAEIIDERRGSEPRARPAPTPGIGARPVPLQPLRADPAPSRAVAAPAPGGARGVSCANCGWVESVQAVEQAAPATGVGAVAGGVLGAVVGNQVGKGSGRAAATVLGAVGGGYVGHRVEQNTRTRTVYQVRVRMQDGSVRQFQRAEPVDVGMPVVVQGRGFRAAAAAPGDGPGGVVPPQ